jgi:hypothetical protein
VSYHDNDTVTTLQAVLEMPCGWCPYLGTKAARPLRLESADCGTGEFADSVGNAGSNENNQELTQGAFPRGHPG